MDQMPNVVIVMSHCSRSSEGFGMRLEEQGYNVWTVDWAFRVPDRLASKEGYDHTEIKGSFTLDNEYPGCPYCKSWSFILCPYCKKVSCYDGYSSTARCGWCGVNNTVGGCISSLKTDSDLECS